MSVVSHRQGGLVNDLLGDVARYCPTNDLLLTCNIPEQVSIHGTECASPRAFWRGG